VANLGNSNIDIGCRQLARGLALPPSRITIIIACASQSVGIKGL
jgi:hypothetical protein